MTIWYMQRFPEWVPDGAWDRSPGLAISATYCPVRNLGHGELPKLIVGPARAERAGELPWQVRGSVARSERETLTTKLEQLIART